MPTVRRPRAPPRTRRCRHDPPVAVVTRGAGRPSSTRLLADRLADAVVRGPGGPGRAGRGRGTSSCAPLAHALADHLLTGFASGALADAVATVRRADGLVAVTPVFSASYCGLFKTFFDVLEPGTLDGKPVLLAATGGTARHSLVLDHALRPLFSYLRAVVVPTGVFAASEDFGRTDERHAVDKRVDAGRGRARGPGGRVGAAEPGPERRRRRTGGPSRQLEDPRRSTELAAPGLSGQARSWRGVSAGRCRAGSPGRRS